MKLQILDEAAAERACLWIYKRKMHPSSEIIPSIIIRVLCVLHPMVDWIGCCVYWLLCAHRNNKPFQTFRERATSREHQLYSSLSNEVEVQWTIHHYLIIIFLLPPQLLNLNAHRPLYQCALGLSVCVNSIFMFSLESVLLMRVLCAFKGKGSIQTN